MPGQQQRRQLLLPWRTGTPPHCTGARRPRGCSTSTWYTQTTGQRMRQRGQIVLCRARGIGALARDIDNSRAPYPLPINQWNEEGGGGVASRTTRRPPRRPPCTRSRAAGSPRTGPPHWSCHWRTDGPSRATGHSSRNPSSSGQGMRIRGHDMHPATQTKRQRKMRAGHANSTLHRC